MPTPTTSLVPLRRVAAFERLGFGLFLHFGLYSQVGKGEWYWNHHQVAAADYLKLVDTFTAAEFDAEAIVHLAAEAGMRYICLTTRHHEGFSLYDTRGLNSYDAPHSPAKRDLIAEFAAACDRHGMGKFFYHTTLDWWHPEFDRDWNKYQEYLRQSVQILCTHYGKVDGFWFDGNWARKDRDWQEDALYGLIRAKQPEAIIVNNSSTGAHGAIGHPETDVVTFEQGRVGHRQQLGRYRAAEMCETINSHWGVGQFDLSHKNPAEIIERLANCRRHGANLLLNVGPTAQGGIPAYEAELLRLVGRWVRCWPAAIYEAVPTTLECRGDDFVLRQGNDWYYFCHNLPIHGNRHLLKGVPGDGLQTIQGDLPKISSVCWADSGEQLAFSQDQAQGMLTFHATPHPYGKQLVIRVARLVGHPPASAPRRTHP